MTMVTGGMGGLGLIASFHMAAHTNAPIISTSRSGRFSTPGSQPLQLMEAIQDKTVHYSVKCDCSKTHELHDLMEILARGVATGRESKTVQVDQVIAAVHRKMQILPPSALRALVDLMTSIEAKLVLAVHELKSDTKQTETDLRCAQTQLDQVRETITCLHERIATSVAQSDPAEDSRFAAVTEAAASVSSRLAS